MLRLIRRYLEAGVTEDGVVGRRIEGTPQGGPSSPLLADVLLDEVDRELERRGHRFVRYADDCNDYVKSPRAGERVLQGLRRCYAKLTLKVNESQTAVGEVWGRKFLGYCFWPTRGLPGQDTMCRAVAAQAIAKLKHRLRDITRRSRGRGLPEVVQALRDSIPGWKAYFRLAQSGSERRRRRTWAAGGGAVTAR